MNPTYRARFTTATELLLYKELGTLHMGWYVAHSTDLVLPDVHAITFKNTTAISTKNAVTTELAIYDGVQRVGRY